MVRISNKGLLESSPLTSDNTISVFVLSADRFLGVCYIPVQWITPGEPMALMQSLHRYCDDSGMKRAVDLMKEGLFFVSRISDLKIFVFYVPVFLFCSC